MVSKIVLLSLCGLISLEAWGKPRFALEARFLARHARHTDGLEESSNQLKLDLIQKARFNQAWTASLGLRHEVEGAYATHGERYAGEIGDEDSQTTWPKEAWVRYSGNVFSATVGYQTVVWGEAFGTAFADIVNPKDYRELALDQLGELRIPIPMINLQWLGESQSFQILGLPEAQHHLLPVRGSEFNTLPDNFRVLRSRPDFGRTDFGAKYGFMIGDVDMSLFGLKAADRFPVYRVEPSGGEFILRPEYKDLTSAGATLTSDLEFMLLRLEVVHHIDREIQVSGAGLSEKADEWVYVVGMDLTQFPGWQVNLQYSEFRLPKKDFRLRKDRESMASLRVAYGFSDDTEVELRVTQRVDENSYLIQPSVKFPSSRQSEITFGFDLLGGDKDTAWGAIKDASRIYIKFIGYLKG